MTKRATREQRESAVKRLAEGSASVEVLAAEIGCHPATINGWVRKASAPAAEAPGSGAGSAGARAALGPAALPTPLTPPPTADEIMALVEGIREQTLSGIAQMRGLDTTNPLIGQLVTMPDNERKILKTLAPQAAKYAGPVMDKAPQICAGGFVLVYLFSGWTAYRKLSKIADLLEAKRNEESKAKNSQPEIEVRAR